MTELSPAAVAAIELPHVGRTAETENFPVGSRLIAAERRPSILLYYRFARAADDVADHPRLDAAEKLQQLDVLDAILRGEPADHADPAQDAAAALRRDFADRRLTLEHARHLLQAFRADAQNRPCRSWSDLLAYCRYSAAPVARFVLELHGESAAARPPAEALCAALQILNHLQDCQADWRDLGRLYIPQEWLDAAGVAPAALLASHATPALRRVLDKILDGVDRLHMAAAPLPRLIADRGLRMEATAVLHLSRRLATRLRRRDPLGGRVGISKFDKALALAVGVVFGWRR
jgi:squalene synthase HpnC